MHAVFDGHRFQITHQRRAAVPGCIGTGRRDVVTFECRQRDANDILEADLPRKTAILLLDPIEYVPRIADEVELVDREHHLADAEQRNEIAVPSRLHQHSLAGVDQDHRGIGGRGSSDHVASVLLVARRVGNDELALVGGEKAIGNIDGDALLPFGGETVEEERVVEIAALRAHLFRIGFERRELILVQHLRLVEETPDQCALAVVDAAAGDEAKQALALVRLQVALDVQSDEVGYVRHQKYPSCFFFSMEPAESWSMTRPCRSEVLANSIS